LNQKLTNLIDRAKNPKDRDFRNHLYIFLICCGISLFIWFLIKMSDEYVSEIKMPVQYDNAPGDKLLVKADDHVSIRLRAKGGDIFSLKFLSGREAVRINLKHADIKKSRYFDRYYILTNNIFDDLTKLLDFDHNIISLEPDTLYLDFEEIITRSIPVKPMVEISCKAQYQVYDSIVIIPAEILVSGPASVIDTLSIIASVSKSFSDLDNTLETQLALSLPLKNDKISYSETYVKLIIPVEKYTESTIELPVAGTSGDSSITIRTFPESVQLTYQVAMKDYKLVKRDMFAVSVYYDSEKDKEKNFLKVKIDHSPDFIRISRITPDKLEYIIQK
jgi:hypothetical protein